MCPNDSSLGRTMFAEGNLKETQTISMTTPGFSGKVNAADIHISPDGKFLYGTMRGDINELSIYSIDKNSKLAFAGRQSTLGKIPRNFEIDPSGYFLLVGNQDSDEIPFNTSIVHALVDLNYAGLYEQFYINLDYNLIYDRASITFIELQF